MVSPSNHDGNHGLREGQQTHRLDLRSDPAHLQAWWLMATQNLLGTGLMQDPGAVPLVVAVAGHRDPRPQDLPILRERFCDLIQKLLTTLPHTPLILLNGLAAGMDSEAAELFLELITEHRQQHPQTPHHQLIAALPKPRQIYLEEDFSEDSTERVRLEGLLKRCDAVLDGDNCPELALPEPARGQSRDQYDPRCYARQGIFIVRHCYLLVAFSNGIDSGKVGGTSQTVAMQRGDVHPLFLEVDEVIASREPGVVVEITTPRASDVEPICPVANVHYWGENLDGRKIDFKAIASLERPNLAALVEAKGCIPARIESINRELPAWPPQEVHNMGVQSSLWRYADHQANAAKNGYIRLCRAVMIASVLIGLSNSDQAWQAASLMVVLASVLIFPMLQRGPKLAFIQWRCLAESLLVTDFWSAVSVNGDTADLFHSHTSQNLAWIRTVQRTRHLQLMILHANPDCLAPMTVVIECCRSWINGQEQWLGRTIHKQQRWDQRYVLVGSLAFLLALAFSFVFLLGAPGGIHSLWSETLLGVSAACFGYRELMGYSDTNARYGRSRTQFARAHEALNLVRADTHAPGMLELRQRLVMEAVGREKIAELNDWVGDQLQRVYTPGG
jgi:hypothetical protein